MTAGNLGTVSVSIVPTLDVAALTAGFDVAVRTAVADALEAAARDLRSPAPAEEPKPRYVSAAAVVECCTPVALHGTLDRETGDFANHAQAPEEIDDLNTGATARDAWHWRPSTAYSDLKEL